MDIFPENMEKTRIFHIFLKKQPKKESEDLLFLCYRRKKNRSDTAVI